MKQYSDRQTQADQLAVLVANQLSQAIEINGKAVLVVAGGSTPELFLNHLSTKDLEWSKVIVIPSDERWVDALHPRSNDRFIHDNLITNKATSARVISLFIEGQQPQAAIPLLEARLEKVMVQPDVCVLGMGEDAHIASLFPGADNLKTALAADSQDSVMAITAPGAEEPRITLTLATLIKSKHMHLLISGPNKLETLNMAKQAGQVEQMPVRAILNCKELYIHYAQ